MKIQEAIQWVDEIKPNAFSAEVNTRWLAELEGRLAADVFLMAPAELGQFRYTWPADKDAELLVDPPYDGVYTDWLQAKVDETNGEYNRYQNTMQLYNEAYGSFLRWFCQLYDPVQGCVSEEARYGTV